MIRTNGQPRRLSLPGVISRSSNRAAHSARQLRRTSTPHCLLLFFLRAHSIRIPSLLLIKPPHIPQCGSSHSSSPSSHSYPSPPRPRRARTTKPSPRPSQYTPAPPNLKQRPPKNTPAEAAPTAAAQLFVSPRHGLIYH
jgi:hypothetical protein